MRRTTEHERLERMGASGMLFGLVALHALFPHCCSGRQSNSGSCASLPESIVRGLTETLDAQTAELAQQFNMSFTVGVAMCDGSEIATSAGLDDRFAHTLLSS